MINTAIEFISYTVDNLNKFNLDDRDWPGSHIGITFVSFQCKHTCDPTSGELAPDSICLKIGSIEDEWVPNLPPVDFTVEDFTTNVMTVRHLPVCRDCRQW